MKKEKMVEVTLCDICKTEAGEYRQCQVCQKEVCLNHARHYKVFASQPEPVFSGYSTLTSSSLLSAPQPDFSGTVCSECGKRIDATLEVSLTKRDAKKKAVA